MILSAPEKSFCAAPNGRKGKCMRTFLLSGLFVLLAPFVIAQQALNDNAVIKMEKAGLSDTVIVDTIKASPGTYDTSANGLIALKDAGVSNKVLAAIVLKSTAPAAGSASASALPPGIDEVGVYYKKNNGAWTEIEPEIVNFKTGGFLKNLASGGLVKGDVNGHISGKSASVICTFPVELAVYVPEGAAITEYQLLHLRQNGNNREFRSVTGGVFHTSGGDNRDLVDFKYVKLAPRLYEITLDRGTGKGEYGLLPPGAIGSTNMASGGTIYAFSIPE